MNHSSKTGLFFLCLLAVLALNVLPTVHRFPPSLLFNDDPIINDDYPKNFYFTELFRQHGTIGNGWQFYDPGFYGRLPDGPRVRHLPAFRCRRQAVPSRRHGGGYQVGGFPAVAPGAAASRVGRLAFHAVRRGSGRGRCGRSRTHLLALSLQHGLGRKRHVGLFVRDGVPVVRGALPDDRFGAIPVGRCRVRRGGLVRVSGASAVSAFPFHGLLRSAGGVRAVVETAAGGRSGFRDRGDVHREQFLAGATTARVFSARRSGSARSRRKSSTPPTNSAPVSTSSGPLFATPCAWS